MTADEVLLKKKPPAENPLYPKIDGRAAAQGLVKSPIRPIYFWGKMKVRPYVTIRDLNNPEGDDEGRTARPAFEAGIRGTF